MRSNRSFPLEFHYRAVFFRSQVIEDTWLWHKRFCHLNFNGLKLLKQKDMVMGLPEMETKMSPCEACISRKHKRTSFPKQSSWRAKMPLELIHTNICGRMRTPSLNDHKYFLISLMTFRA